MTTEGIITNWVKALEEDGFVLDHQNYVFAKMHHPETKEFVRVYENAIVTMGFAK
jgi:hypothetical protein